VAANTPFEILEIKAAGAFGTVCIAREAGNPEARIVAMKVLHPEHTTSTDFMKRARDEARMLSRMTHEHLVRVDPVLQVNGRPVMIMEYVQGCDVSQLVRANPNGIPAGPALELVRRAALGLDAAFNGPANSGDPMRVIHRDIKPANLLVSNTGEVKVADFGIAKATFDDREAQTADIILGTPAYSAPERQLGEPDSPAGDVYALGITLVELLTGKQIVLSIREDRHVATVLSTLPHIEPEGVDAEAVRMLVRDMLEYMPVDRPAAVDGAHRARLILEQAELEVDMLAFARASVVPIYRKRDRIPVKNHPQYPAIRFLEGGTPVALPSRAAANPAHDEAIRQALSRRGWEDDPAALGALLRDYPGWTTTPFLEVLAKAKTPWWAVWKQSATPAELAAALGALTLRPDNDALRHAESLRSHPSREVVDAAQQLIDCAGRDET
jgi:serine/threonine protein kinase